MSCKSSGPDTIGGQFGTDASAARQRCGQLTIGKHRGNSSDVGAHYIPIPKILLPLLNLYLLPP
jgi:hypothetical protein